MDFVIDAFVGAFIMAVVIAATLDREPDVNLKDCQFIIVEEDVERVKVPQSHWL